MKKLMCIMVILAMAAGCITRSEGDRVGTISKFAKKGVFISTWEGEAILGGQGASGNQDNTWYFSVEDEAVVEKIKKFKDTGRLVVLQYKQEMFVAGWRADTNYFIQDVKFADNN